MTDPVHRPASAPFFSQWETRDLTLAVLAGGSAALRNDPLWARSGAENIDEYVAWANNACGMACLKMILAARLNRIVPILHLAREATAYGAYTVDPMTAEIKGLIYAPFVRFIGAAYGIRGEVLTGLTAQDLPEVMGRSAFFMASVHPSIRWPDHEPPARGGHLVLVLSAGDGHVVFHNPSGHDASTQEGVRLSSDRFAAFFAGRGISIL